MTPLVAVLTLPLLGAFMAIILPLRVAAMASIVASLLSLCAAILLAYEVWRGGVVELALGGWPPPLGILIAADGLGTALVVMTALVMVAVAIAARHEMAPTLAGPRAAFGFWPLMLLAWGALNAVFLSRDLFNLYVGLELLGLASVSLVAVAGKAGAIEAALRYLFFALTGSLVYLGGVILAYAAHGTLDISMLAVRNPAATDTLALALMTVGLLAKTALFPFHVWLPPAHSAAPSTASAVLSALVPKASFLILLRLWFEAMPDHAEAGGAMALAALGAVAVFWGGMMALAQTRLKMIVAYSTVAQLGYFCLIFPLSGGTDEAQPWIAGAWTGMSFLMLSHGLAKAAMFLSASVFIAAVGSDRLSDLRGLARALPMTSFGFALAAITLMGLPPSGGFTGKYLMMTAAFSGGQWPWALILVGGGLLAAAYLYRPLAHLFAREIRRVPRPVPRLVQALPLILAIFSILLGLASEVPFDFLAIGRPLAAREGL